MEVQGDTDEATENVAPEADATTTEQTNVQPAPPSTENQSKNNGRFHLLYLDWLPKTILIYQQ